jgi:hypothetical protein
MLDACEKREVQQNSVSPAMIGVDWQQLFIRLKRPKYTSEFRRCCPSPKPRPISRSDFVVFPDANPIPLHGLMVSLYRGKAHHLYI